MLLTVECACIAFLIGVADSVGLYALIHYLIMLSNAVLVPAAYVNAAMLHIFVNRMPFLSIASDCTEK